MASAGLPRVLRIPRDGTGEDYVLLHVSSSGRKLHDLKLVGTDNEEAFTAKVKHSQTNTLKSSRFQGEEAQWEQALSKVFLGAEDTEFTRGIEGVAKVKAETSLTITIQKSIEGIKQKLGTIVLTVTPDEDIDLFSWCAITIQNNETSSGGLSGLQTELTLKEAEVQKLNDKLAELVKAKAAYEEELIEKFSVLLNEKKLKIRDQQRLLQSANASPASLAAVRAGRVAQRNSPPRSSGNRKRRAAVEEEGDDGADTVDRMEVDEDLAPGPNSADEDERRTDDEQTTADEDSGDEAPPINLPLQSTDNIQSPGSGTPDVAKAVIPPKRDLPFAKKPATPFMKPAPVLDGSETESDDEL